jgi:hypothetical protein
VIQVAQVERRAAHDADLVALGSQHFTVIEDAHAASHGGAEVPAHVRVVRSALARASRAV